VKADGTGSATVYDNEPSMKAEENTLRFEEPYLLAMATDSDGNTGC
jgi:hypothetical protein